MLSNNFFYWRTTRKFVIAFGSMFDDIFIDRQFSDGTEQKHILVPLSYAPKQKWLYRIKQDPYLDKERVALILPRLAFTLDNLTYDADRMLQSTTKNIATIDNTHRASQYVPVPYDFNFSLYAMTDNQEDGLQIIEQCIPMFRPAYTLTVNVVPEMKLAYDVPVILNSVICEDNYDTDFESKRVIIWTLQFTMKGWVFGPMSTQGIIRRTIINEIVPSGSGPLTSSEMNNVSTIHKIGEPDPITAGPDDEWEFRMSIEEDF